ncbi:hypothetical protein MF4642_07555 [Acinetobacter sp. MF4642]|nr:hypothetical protein MF4642_07555 [Acinetobacter sp. MF4642]
MINIRNFVAKTLAITFIILLFLFAFTWIIFDFQNSSDSIKDTWIIVSSLFSGIATLAAAYIATQLFNDWREQHNKTILANEAKAVFKKLSNSFLLLATYQQTVRRLLGQNATFTMSQVKGSLGPLIDFNQEMTVDLKYFEDLAQLSQITPHIREYNNCVRKHIDYIDTFYSNPKNQNISQIFIDNCESFTEDLAPITHSIKEILIDYILVRDALT